VGKEGEKLKKGPSVRCIPKCMPVENQALEGRKKKEKQSIKSGRGVPQFQGDEN